ncbi:hypothetical protein ScPMuIL_006416 [Solemya velum]
MAEESSVPAIAVTAAVGAVVLLVILLCSVGKKNRKEDKDDNASEQKEEKTAVKTEKTSKKTKINLKPKRTQHVPFSHSWSATTLKGHSAPVLSCDFSPNGKYLISVSEDRIAMVWNIKDFSQKEHKFTRANIELDHATKVKFSPDSKAFLVNLYNGNTIRIFRIGKKEDGTMGNIAATFEFPKKHEAEIIDMGIASNGKFVMTCTGDTSIIIWSIKGEVMANIDTHQMNNSHAAVSPCGRFVASAGFTPDVKVWEVCFDKSGNFQEVKRAFELKGHGAAVYSFGFNNDSSRMASVSKDGTWKFWDTNVRYDLGQDPYLLLTGTLKYKSPCIIELSPDGRTVAIASENSISMHNTSDGAEEGSFENVHSAAITELSFDTLNRYLVSTGDKHIQVFHNIPGYRATIADLQEKEKKATGQAMRERIRQQVKDARSSLDNIINKSVNGVAVS